MDRAVMQKKFMNFYILYFLIFVFLKGDFLEGKKELYQRKQIKAIMKRAWEIPIYRRKFEESNTTPDDYNCAEDLKKFPLLTKQELREGLDYIRKKNPGKYDNYCFTRTSGTTGIPIVSLYSPKEMAFNSANWIRILMKQHYNPILNSCMGLRAAYRIPKNGDSIFQKMGLFRRYLADYMLDGAKLVDEYNRIKPDLLYGHKSKLLQMCIALKNKSITFHKPRWFSPTSEQLNSTEVDLLKSVFGEGIFATYGTEECGGGIAFTKEGDLSEYQISWQSHVVNFLNTPGGYCDKGRMIITSLFLKEFPVINYDIGDSASREKRGAFEYISNIQGRVDDFFKFEDGSIVARQPFYAALCKRKEIIQARFVQLGLRNIRVEACLFDEYKKNEQEIMNKLISDVKLNLKHDEVNITYQIYDSLQPDENGKIRFMNCKLGENALQ